MTMTNILLTLIAVLLLARVIRLYMKNKRRLPKYQIGDKVRFVNASPFSKSVWIGTIWRIRKHWYCEPYYNIVWKCDPHSGTDYSVSESDIIELIERTDKSVPNPFSPIGKKIKNYMKK